MTVPKLRFKEFQGNWEENVMSKVGSFKKGSNLSKADLSKEGRPCVLYGELYTTYGPVISEVNSRTDKQINNPVYGKRNDVLIPASGESAEDIATASSLKVNNVLLGGDINIFTPEKDNGIFISYQINSARKKQLVRWAQGASVVHIYKDSLSKLNLRLPSLEEQEKIAGFYEKLELRVKLQHKKIEALQEQKKGLLQKIFSRQLRFQDENGEEFPNWSVIPLKRLASKITQKNTMSIKNVISNSATKGLVRQREYFDKDIANLENVGSYYVIKKDDFVYNPRVSQYAPYGPVSMYTYDEQGVVSPLYLCFEVTNEQINKDYLYRFFQSSAWHKHIYTNGDQGARHDRVSIRDSVFMELPVLVPSMGEQVKIARLFEVLDDKIEKEEKKLQFLNEQKQGLMQQMFV